MGQISARLLLLLLLLLQTPVFSTSPPHTSKLSHENTTTLVPTYPNAAPFPSSSSIASSGYGFRTSNLIESRIAFLISTVKKTRSRRCAQSTVGRRRGFFFILVIFSSSLFSLSLSSSS